MANTETSTTLREDGATHLLIRQLPTTSNEIHVDELCSQAIPVLLQVNDPDSEQQLPQGTVTVENILSKDEDDCNDSGQAEVPNESANLEEFMDVVTTYKCKFCPFNCAWKSGLMSHIRSTHFEVINKVSVQQFDNDKTDVSAMLETDSTQSSTTLLLDAGPTTESVESTEQNFTTTHERQIFLCGQCSKGFNSLDQCKSHMIEDHQIIVESHDKESNDANCKKVKKPTKGRRRNPLNFVYQSQETTDENDKDFDTMRNKRKVRPPRILEDDYVLNRRKKRNQNDDANDKNYKCEECGCRFRQENSLSYHERCHTSGGKNLECPECHEKFENWRLLSLHLWKIHQIDVELHACPDCEYRTFSSFKLENHRRIHSEERSFICITCGKGFKQVSQLRNHSVVHMDRKNMSEKRWYSEQECEICGRTFSDSKCLRKHLQAVHNKLKPFVCSHCGHTSARKAMLQLHMRQHTGEKPFQCDQCDYRTGDHNSLRRHKMRHTGIKPYKCPHCPYACIQAISYKTHLKNKHPGMEGLYTCSTCSFRSVSRDNYLNHLADHKRGAIPKTPTSTSNIGRIDSVLPGNVAAAQIIYSCLNALSQDSALANTVATTSAIDGTRTFTIQIPADQEIQDAEQYYLAIQGPQDVVEAELNECKDQCATEFTVATDAIQLSAETSDGIKAVRFITTSAEQVNDGALSLPLVVTET